MHFLIIDDDPVVREILAAYLHSEWPDAQCEEYNPIESPQPPSTEQLGHCDLILLDHDLGIVQGLSWLQSICATPIAPPIIYITGAGDERVAAQAMKLGAADYLPKRELRRDSLVETVRRVFAEQSELDRTLTGSRADELISGYRLMGTLSMQTAAVVYRAVRIADDAEVAIKTIPRPLELSQTAMERFRLEYSLLTAIDHPHVVKVFEHGTTEKHLYTVMELLNGGSLRERIQQGLAKSEALEYGEILAATLSQLHQHEIIHRDLKPSNVMFDDDGRLVLIDFGIAKSLNRDQELTRHGEVFGSPHYMSPEQILGESIDRRSDLYALGIILFEMLTGRKPITGHNPHSILYNHHFGPLPQLDDGLDLCQPLIDGLLAKHREERFSDAAEVATIIQDLRLRGC